MESYRTETQNLHHRRVNYILIGGGMLTLIFSVLDLLTVPQYYQEFWACRLGTILFAIFLFQLNNRDNENKYPFVIGFTGYSCVAGTILFMVYRMGGVSSAYYVGLIVTFTIYVTLAPLTLKQTLACGLLLVSSYLLTIALTHPLGPPYLPQLYSNMFFIVCFIFIIATQSWADTRARRSEFLLRSEEAAAAEMLSGQAIVLEEEVERRSREQEELEARYRLLFNQIADDVVVISPSGKIVQSNEAFDTRYLHRKQGRVRSLYEITPENERESVKKIVGEIVASGRPLAAVRLSLVQQDGNVIEVEVNGNILQRKGTVKGVLLIIRDLSVRKSMEKQLIRSLETKKRTETSAILILAKLSEFKDVTPENHLERIREYCLELAVELSGYGEFKDALTSTYIEDLYHAAILHDIGKVAIPDEYMAGDAPLEEYEKDVLRRHTIIGGDVIKEMEDESGGSGFLSLAKHIAYFHHERWDGKGYPYGLSGREIPLAARIMALADAYEEITTGTILVSGMKGHRAAVAHITESSGTRFDPTVVQCFLAREEEFLEIFHKFPEKEHS